jgi:hypothetical protein
MPSRVNGGPFWVGSQPLDINVLEGDQWWDGTTLRERQYGAWVAITGPALGTVIRLGIGGLVSVAKTVTAAPSVLAAISIPANTYSLIRIRAWGTVTGIAPSTLQKIAITSSVGGELDVQLPAHAVQSIPWYFEIVLTQQAPTTINLQENAPADDANTTVNLNYYTVEGIV